MDLSLFSVLCRYDTFILASLFLHCITVSPASFSAYCKTLFAAETSTPPLLDSAQSSDSDFFVCRTRTCIQPSHYFPAAGQEGSSGEPSNATCYYGAKQCPSKLARAKKTQESRCHYTESEKEDSPSVEDVQLLRTERQGCCKKKQEPPPEEKCCKSSHEVVVDTTIHHETETREDTREDSPQISCCHNAKAPTESQEQIIQ